jgi:hypothetical protein
MLQPKQKLGTVSCVMYGATSMQLIPQRCGYRQEQEQRELAQARSFYMSRERGQSYLAVKSRCSLFA